MIARVLLALLVGWWCTACVSTPASFMGRYNRATHTYSNTAAGFRLMLPQNWAIRTPPQAFTVPVQLRPDQEQVLEAYDSAAQLGLVVVVQRGPVAEIAELVRRMQTVSEERLTQRLQRPDATDLRQLSLRQIVLHGRDIAEWVYTATDTTGGQSVEVTVSYYIVKVGENYVYLTFSTPATHYSASRPAIDAILQTFEAPQRLSS